MDCLVIREDSIQERSENIIEDVGNKIITLYDDFYVILDPLLRGDEYVELMRENFNKLSDIVSEVHKSGELLTLDNIWISADENNYGEFHHAISDVLGHSNVEDDEWQDMFETLDQMYIGHIDYMAYNCSYLGYHGYRTIENLLMVSDALNLSIELAGEYEYHFLSSDDYDVTLNGAQEVLCVDFNCPEDIGRIRANAEEDLAEILSKCLFCKKDYRERARLALNGR